MANILPKARLHRLQLRDVIVDKIVCRRMGDFDPKAACEPKVSLRAKVLSDTEVQSYLTLLINFPQDPKPFSMELRLRGLFVSEEPCKRSGLRQFAETAALVPLLPWAREMVATLTRQMGFPPLMLPLINVLESVGNLADEKDK